MASKAVASLDQWLAEAEWVLQESHEVALSPSQAIGHQSEQSVWSVSLGSFGLGLPSLLERLCARPGRWILIAEDSVRPHRYWQALAFEDGSLVVEAGSGTPPLASERLSPEETSELEKLGWSPPEPPTSPNWQHVEPTTSPDIESVVSQALGTFRKAFRLADCDRLALTLLSSPRRGGTPAGEQIPGVLAATDGG